MEEKDMNEIETLTKDLLKEDWINAIKKVNNFYPYIFFYNREKLCEGIEPELKLIYGYIKCGHDLWLEQDFTNELLEKGYVADVNELYDEEYNVLVLSNNEEQARKIADKVAEEYGWSIIEDSLGEDFDYEDDEV